MVVGYNLGDVIISWVKLPGTGSDKTLKSSRCDLSVVSRLVTPSSDLPTSISEPIIHQNTPVKEKERNSGRKRKFEDNDVETTTATNSTQQPSQRQKKTITMHYQNPPVVTNNPPVVTNGNPLLMSDDNNCIPPVNPIQQTVLQIPVITTNQPQKLMILNIPQTLDSSINQTTFPQLLVQPQIPSQLVFYQQDQQQQQFIIEENKALRKSLTMLHQQHQQVINEKDALNKKLCLFQQLFKDKDRLNSVVQRINNGLDKK